MNTGKKQAPETPGTLKPGTHRINRQGFGKEKELSGSTGTPSSRIAHNHEKTLIKK